MSHTSFSISISTYNIIKSNLSQSTSSGSALMAASNVSETIQQVLFMKLVSLFVDWLSRGEDHARTGFRRHRLVLCSDYPIKLMIYRSIRSRRRRAQCSHFIGQFNKFSFLRAMSLACLLIAVSALFLAVAIFRSIFSIRSLLCVTVSL